MVINAIAINGAQSGHAHLLLSTSWIMYLRIEKDTRAKSRFCLSWQLGLININVPH